MPYIFSQVITQQLAAADLCIEDRRNNPVRGRKTKFRLMQQNMLAYTFDSFVPGTSPSHVHNTTPFVEVVEQPLVNADLEGQLRFNADYVVDSSARAKVAGDIFEILLTAVMWNAVARWNAYMRGGPWPTTPRHSKPQRARNPGNQFAILNLPRGYDWVRLLDASASRQIETIRRDLDTKHQLALPTSTPDIALVRLPEDLANQPVWATLNKSLDHATQDLHGNAYQTFEGRLSPSDLVLAIAAKKSLRSDRLYQPLYEANLMQLMLEGFLGAPRVEFEVHTLDFQGTGALSTYQAASLYGVALHYQAPRQQPLTGSGSSGVTSNAHMHRAVRELYIPRDALEVAGRVLSFIDNL